MLNKRFSLVGLGLLMAALAGCGSDNRTTTSGNTPSYEASAACISCHATTKVSPVTGALIAEEWAKSTHNTGNGASCADCHKPQGHPNGAITSNPSNTVCEECHTRASMRTGVAHFGDPADPTKAFYVSSLDQTGGVAVGNMTFPGGNGCQTCHNPHDTSTLMTINREFAASSHGKTDSLAFTEDPWRIQSSGNCGRCHTGSGFRYYVTNAQAVLPKATFKGYTTVREVIGCNACHNTYNWKRLNNDPTVATYVNFSTPYKRLGTISKNFPSNIGDTKLCLPCHSGRTGGGDIAAATGLNNKSFMNPHYMPAAGLMYIKLGYTNFVPGATVIGSSTYAKTLTASEDLTGGVNSTHRKLGTPAINGDSHNPAFFVSGNLDSGGPCVVCHLKGGHSLKINAKAYDAVCIKCHDSELGVPVTSANFEQVFLAPQREAYENTVHLAIKVLELRYGIRYSASYPYFFDLNLDPTGATACKDWTRGGTVNGNHLMGAAYNIKLAKADEAAYVHARTFTRRLLYDTIDFLDDGTNNLSVGATALAVEPTVFQKGATAFSDGTLTAFAPGTSESMAYIIGWSRSTGAWNTPERP